MTTRRYQFRISGLKEQQGHIKAAALQRVLSAILTTAERTTRLLTTGSGSARGPRPGWLDATLDFTVTDLEPGSTIFGIDAPQLRDTACDQFAQTDLWGNRPPLEDTALDLAAQAINELQLPDPAGDYFDSSVLDAILKFRTAAGVAGVRYDMIPQGPAHGRFSLDETTCLSVEDRLKNIPAPRSFVVSGRLDEIKHGSGRFRLLVNRTSALYGRVDTTVLNVETLRPLWGKPTTIEGMVHFKVNGQPRLIEAHRIAGRLEGSNIFEEIPSIDVSPSLFHSKHRQTGTFDPLDLGGTWPGEESIDDLLAQLD